MAKHILLFIALVYCSTGFAQQPGVYVVYFASGQYNLTNQAILTIEQGIKDNSLKHIDSVKIHAYCDTVGGLLYNDTLAQNRANTVKNYLYERNAYGMFKEVTAFGERKPLNNNSTEKQKALNRRVEVMFYAHSYPDKDTAKPATITANTIPATTKADTNTIALQKLRSLFSTAEVGNKIRLPNLNFYGSRHFVVKESLPVLDTLAAILRSYPTLEVEIQGYVCCVPVGKEAYDVTERKYNLSSTRAEAIFNDLVKNGIDAKRLKHKGYGSQPMVAEVDDEAKALNRRVEIKILKR